MDFQDPGESGFCTGDEMVGHGIILVVWKPLVTFMRLRKGRPPRLLLCAVPGGTYLSMGRTHMNPRLLVRGRGMSRGGSEESRKLGENAL